MKSPELKPKRKATWAHNGATWAHNGATWAHSRTIYRHITNTGKNQSPITKTLQTWKSTDKLTFQCTWPSNIATAEIWTNRSCSRPTNDSIRFKTQRPSIFSTRIYRCRLWPAKRYHPPLVIKNQDFTTRQASNFRIRFERTPLTSTLHLDRSLPDTSTQTSLVNWFP